MKVLQVLLLVIGLSISANAQNVSEYAEKTILTGTVYDADGSVIVDAIVTAVDQKRQRFESKTTSEGVYTLRLPFNAYNSSYKFKVAKYEVSVTAVNFEKSVFNNFKVVPGKTQLDVALDVGGNYRHYQNI